MNNPNDKLAGNVHPRLWEIVDHKTYKEFLEVNKKLYNHSLTVSAELKKFYDDTNVKFEDLEELPLPDISSEQYQEYLTLINYTNQIITHEIYGNSYINLAVLINELLGKQDFEYAKEYFARQENKIYNKNRDDIAEDALEYARMIFQFKNLKRFKKDGKSQLSVEDKVTIVRIMDGILDHDYHWTPEQIMAVKVTKLE